MVLFCLLNSQFILRLLVCLRIDMTSILRLVIVVDGLASWGHRRLSHRCALHLRHLVVDLVEHLISNHVHHGVDTTSVLLLLLRSHLHWHVPHGLDLRLGLSKDVQVVRVVHVVHHIVDLSLADAPSLKELSTGVEVKSHLLELLQESFLLVDEVGRDHCHVLIGWPHGQLLLDHAALGLSARVWGDVVLAHPVQQLTWNFH